MRTIYLSLLLIFGLNASLFAQTYFNPYQSEMNTAYQMFPDVPKGVLEAWSFTRTHFVHLDENLPESCFGLPKTLSVMGLTENGKGYFNDNLDFVSQLSGYSVSDIASNPQISILAFASAYSQLLSVNNITSQNPADHVLVLKALSEIPRDNNLANDFAMDCQLYEIFRFLEKSANQSAYNFNNYNINMIQIFGQSNYEVLSASNVNISGQITNNSGTAYVPSNLKAPDYPPGLWVATPSCNYSSRSGTPISAVTIHTIQGSYSGAISWAQNCSANVSYHYVVRSSDGQVTQMLLEANKGWHVGNSNPYAIGIEHEGWVSDASWYTTALYTASADICRDITQSGYGISPLRTYFGASSSGLNTLGSCTKIKGHQHFPSQSHTDPGINWNWSRFYLLINNSTTPQTITAATGSYYDTGGSAGNYADDERELLLIQPAGASSITLTVNQFDLETNWDFMLIYDGATTAAPLIGKYTGTTIPSSITSTSGSILIEFRSDCATTSPGWDISWTTNGSGGGPLDVTAPTATVSTPNNWKTADFTANFTSSDNTGGSGVHEEFYQVIDYDGVSEWRANANNGFFSDNFENTLHSDWTSLTGSWAVTNNVLQQTDQANSNTNTYAPLNQNAHNEWLHHYAMQIYGTGTNKRAGFHFMCDDATQSNRGNSYFVWFRTDNDKVQIYKVVNDVFSLETDEPVTLNDNQWYDVKITYNKTTGLVKVWLDNIMVASYTDPSPLTAGNAISFRSGEAAYEVNNLKSYHERGNSELVTVGPNSDLRYQNINSTSFAGKVKSMIIDSAGNISSVVSDDLNVDWTPPSNVSALNDGTGADIDNQTNTTQLSANWAASTDSHSDISRYWYAIGTTSGGNDIVNWTDNWFNTSFTHNGLSLNVGSTYYITVKAENGAGLQSGEITSDGVSINAPTNPPVAGFNVHSTNICLGDSIQLVNNSTDATTYLWTTDNGSLTSSTAASPYLVMTSSGTANISLTASGPGGSDVATQTLTVTVDPAPVAIGTVNGGPTFPVNNTVTFTNNSSNANGYVWDFGDGNTSTDANPWNIYTSAGSYTVTLVAINGTCANDTVFIQVEVTGASDIASINGLQSFQVIPNPNDGNFRLDLYLNSQMNLSVKLFDATGRFIGDLHKADTPAGKLSISSERLNQALSTGIYEVVIVTENGAASKKVVIQK